MNMLKINKLAGFDAFIRLYYRDIRYFSTTLFLFSVSSIRSEKNKIELNETKDLSNYSILGASSSR